MPLLASLLGLRPLAMPKCADAKRSATLIAYHQVKKRRGNGAGAGADAAFGRAIELSENAVERAELERRRRAATHQR